MLAPEQGENLASIQSIGVRYAHGKMTREEAAREGCRVCYSAGGDETVGGARGVERRPLGRLRV
jgi:hypothetical protein